MEEPECYDSIRVHAEWGQSTQDNEKKTTFAVCMCVCVCVQDYERVRCTIRTRGTPKTVNIMIVAAAIDRRNTHSLASVQ